MLKLSSYNFTGLAGNETIKERVECELGTECTRTRITVTSTITTLVPYAKTARGQHRACAPFTRSHNGLGAISLHVDKYRTSRVPVP